MLTTLRIKNLALVADLTLELQPGCNVITGETGAGKSIIIGGLNLVLGERADRTLIRSGSDSCSVEAVFDVSCLDAKLKSFLEENGLEPCEEKQLVLKRIPTPEPPPLLSDRFLVQMVVRNLITNAIKYTETGSVELRVEVQNGAHRISVKDTGPGIA